MSELKLFTTSDNIVDSLSRSISQYLVSGLSLHLFFRTAQPTCVFCPSVLWKFSSIQLFSSNLLHDFLKRQYVKMSDKELAGNWKNKERGGNPKKCLRKSEKKNPCHSGSNDPYLSWHATIQFSCSGFFQALIWLQKKFWLKRYTIIAQSIHETYYLIYVTQRLFTLIQLMHYSKEHLEPC